MKYSKIALRFRVATKDEIKEMWGEYDKNAYIRKNRKFIPCIIVNVNNGDHKKPVEVIDLQQRMHCVCYNDVYIGEDCVR